MSLFLACVTVIGSSGLGSTPFSVVGIMVESQWFAVAFFLGHADAADHSASSCSVLAFTTEVHLGTDDQIEGNLVLALKRSRML